MRDARVGATRAGIAIACVALACARHDPPLAQPGATTPTASATPAAMIDASVPSAGAWADAIREERWDDAWTQLAALPESTRAQPEVRYAMARTALARGDAKSAIGALEGLEAALPLLADDAQRWRAEAQLVAGPFDVAGEWYSARGTPSALLHAAAAFEKAKAATRARAACDRVLGNDKRTRAQEAEARAIRLRLSPDDPIEADDARWLATHAPDLTWGKRAESALTKLAPSKPLTSDELLARAEAYSLAGRTEDATRAIDHVEAAPGRKVPLLERMRAKGDALYRGGKYADAARVLSQCAAAGGAHAGEDSFRSARALARADKDDEAILALGHVAIAQAGTRWGDEASFLGARLQLLHGRWKEAASGLDAYVAKYPNGQEKHEAARDRALARLMAGDARGARPLFEQLADDETDPLSAARARTMAALAALRDGDRTHAIARWTDVARARPLSWPALVARARLAQIGAPLPPVIDGADDAGAEANDSIGVTLPPPVDLLHRIGLDADAENELHEREAAVAASAQGRSTEALCDAYGLLSRAKRRYQIAQQIPAALLALAPTPRTRWGWDCAFPTPYAGEVDARVRENDVPASLVYAVMRQESGFDPDVVSGARAVGLLQLLPETARAVAKETPDPDDDGARLTSPPLNVALGARYLHDLLTHFHGVTALAVAAYNAGPESIDRWLARGDKSTPFELDLFVERIPYSETRTYVARVMGNLARYGYLRTGEAGVPTLQLDAQ